MHKFTFPLIMCSLLLSACATYAPVEQRVIGEPSPDAFTLCYGDECEVSADTGLSGEEWKEIVLLFKSVNSAETERDTLARAIRMFEQYTNGRIRNVSREGSGFDSKRGAQPVDRYDVAVNTSTYLHILRNYGLLKYHKPRDIIRKTGFHLTDVDQTATIVDITTGLYYAVDAWPVKQSVPVQVVPQELWIRGWLGL
jgi:hypothetical protein